MTLRPSCRIDRAAWTIARALTPHVLLAPPALPWTLLSAVPDSLPRGLYLDPSRLGVVIPYRPSPVLDILALSPAMIDLFAGCFFGAPVSLALIVPAEWMVLRFGGVTTLYMIGLLFLLPRGRGNLFPWGPEAPKYLWREIASLPHPLGTRPTGSQFALRRSRRCHRRETCWSRQ